MLPCYTGRGIKQCQQIALSLRDLSSCDLGVTSDINEVCRIVRINGQLMSKYPRRARAKPAWVCIARGQNLVEGNETCMQTVVWLCPVVRRPTWPRISLFLSTGPLRTTMRDTRDASNDTYQVSFDAFQASGIEVQIGSRCRRHQMFTESIDVQKLIY